MPKKTEQEYMLTVDAANKGRFVVPANTKVWKDQSGLWRETIFGNFDFEKKELKEG